MELKICVSCELFWVEEKVWSYFVIYYGECLVTILRERSVRAMSHVGRPQTVRRDAGPVLVACPDDLRNGERVLDGA